MRKIILEKNKLILKKNIGQIEILKADILEVQRMANSTLTMTYGSKGFFGIIGSTMDNAISFVKDRKNMIQITTKDNKYLFSSERPEDLIREIKEHNN